MHWLNDIAIPSATASNPPLYLAIADTATDVCMGCIALEPKKDIEHCTLEIAYWLDEPYWGKKVISAAIGMIVKWGMKAYPWANRIEAGILSRYVSSRLLGQQDDIH
jgi:RimJ/RimL family protein N-acetyltransferase